MRASDGAVVKSRLDVGDREHAAPVG